MSWEVSTVPLSTRVISGASKRLDPCVDLLVVVADRLSGRRAEDDVELIEAAEARQEGTKCGDRPAVARQKVEHVGVEPQTL